MAKDAHRLTDAEVRANLIGRGYTFRPTTDDWSPTYPDGTVAMSSVIPLRNGQFRIAVWGGDDDGFERDFDTEPEARRTLAALPAIITKTDLKARGFGPA
jgi:hypothetical protein